MRNRRAGPKAKSSPAVTASASSITNRPREALHSRGDFQCVYYRYPYYDPIRKSQVAIRIGDCHYCSNEYDLSSDIGT